MNEKQLSNLDEQLEFKKVLEAPTIQKTGFTIKTTHPTTQEPLGMKPGNVWISTSGGTVQLNVMLENKEVNMILLNKV